MRRIALAAALILALLPIPTIAQNLVCGSLSSPCQFWAAQSTSTGSANSQIVSTISGGFVLNPGNSIVFVPGFTNSGATVVNVDSTGNLPVHLNGSALPSGAIVAGVGVTLIYNGTSFDLPIPGNLASSGTVTTVSVASANGFAGSVANPTTTPAITLSETITGLLKGNGTAISAASAGTDYLTPSGSGAALTGILWSQIGSTPTTLTGYGITSPLPVAQGGTGIGSLGTGVATALGVNVGTAGAFVVNGGAGGTPLSITLTNGTGLPVSTGISGLGTGVATALAATPSGSGSLCLTTSCSMTTPTIGAATATTVNGVTIPSSTDTAALLGKVDQTLSGGANLTAFSIGTVSSGTTTIDCGKNPVQYLTNGGAFTLAAPSNDGTCIVYDLNNGSAGAITFSGFTVGASTGDALTTTNTNKFFISIMRINSVATYIIKALQ